MYNPFMTVAHCAAFAHRRASATGGTVHVVATGHPDMPLNIVDEATLFQCGDRLSFEDLRFTADPHEADQPRWTA